MNKKICFKVQKLHFKLYITKKHYLFWNTKNTFRIVYYNMVVDLKVYNKDKYEYEVQIASKNKRLKIEEYSDIVWRSKFKRKVVGKVKI